MLSSQLPWIFCYIRQTLWIFQAKPSVAMSSKTAWTRNGDSDVPMFPSRVRTSLARSAWYEAEDSPETSAYCLTIRRINTEMYKILTAVLLRFKSSRLALFDPPPLGSRYYDPSESPELLDNQQGATSQKTWIFLSDYIYFSPDLHLEFLSVSVGCAQSICIQLGWRNPTRCNFMHIFIYC